MTTAAPSPLDSLTPREREVLTLVAQGLSLPEIAEKLHRSLKTIETHRLSLGRKLNASNRVELTRIAIGAGLAPIEPSAEDPLAESAKNAAARHDLEGRARALQCFQQINDEVFSATGPTFLRRLVLSLTRVLGVRSAVVCLLTYENDKPALTTLALCSNGAMLDPEKYFARCTPCESVLVSGQACYADSLAERFPEDRYLDLLGDTSYVGVRLEDQQGNTLGIMSVLDDKPLDDGLHIETILRMFAPRAAAELAQLSVSDRMRELTEDLESEVEKRTEEVRRANRLFSSMVSRSSDGFCSCDPEGDVTLANPSMCELIGRDAGEVVGKLNVLDLIYPDDRDAYLANRYENTQVRTYNYNIRLLHADGTAIPCNVTSHAQVDDDGVHLGCFAVITPDKPAAQNEGA